MRVLALNVGDYVFRCGEPSIAVYVIEHGEIAIRTGDGYAAFDVVRLHDGDLFGESGVLEGRVRSASAVAVVETRLVETQAVDFLHAFGVNEKALALLKLLCRRLRSTTRREALARAERLSGPPSAPGSACRQPLLVPIRLVPDSKRLMEQLGPVTVDIRKFPFLVGNRYGGETSPVSSSRAFCIPAAAESDFSAPHFEIARRDDGYVIRDLSRRVGTIVNQRVLSRTSKAVEAELREGENMVIAGDWHSPFKFTVIVGEEHQ